MRIPIVLFIALCSFIFGGCSLADIRTEKVKSGITPEMITQGKALLQQVQKTYRADLWRAQKTMTVTYADHWPGFFTRLMAMPWHKNDQKVQFEMALGTDDARLEFLEDPKAGEVWGIQHWATYKIKVGEAVKFKKDSDIWFWLPTYSYFTQCAYRIAEAELVAFAGEDSLNGQNYDKVFATWGAAEPNGKIDQYILWINKQTGYIDLVEYTIRDMQKFMKGKLFYADYRLVDGIPVAHKQSAGDVFGGADVVHQAEFSGVKFSKQIDNQRFYPDANQKWSKYN
ncbi:MAG: hypothetical protein ACOY5B_02595 [Spirochaetota bacterium]